MAHASKIPALTGTPFSILALGRHLGELRDQAQRLDCLAHELGEEEPMADLTPERLQQRRATCAGKATYRHIEAIEDAILTGRATCPGDAVVQLMVAAAAVGRTTSYAEAPTKAEFDVLENAMESVLRGIAAEVDVKLGPIGGAAYASAWCELWPEVDVSAVVPSMGSAEDWAIDERGLPKP